MTNEPKSPPSWEWQSQFDERFEDKFVDAKSYRTCMKFIIQLLDQATQEGYNRGRTKCLEQHGLTELIAEAKEAGREEEMNASLITEKTIRLAERARILALVEEMKKTIMFLGVKNGEKLYEEEKIWNAALNELKSKLEKE